jgi:hypothetical protein
MRCYLVTVVVLLLVVATSLLFAPTVGLPAMVLARYPALWESQTAYDHDLREWLLRPTIETDVVGPRHLFNQSVMCHISARPVVNALEVCVEMKGGGEGRLE